MEPANLESLPVILILENLRSLHNVGAIFRTADGAGVHELILAGLTPTPPRVEIDKTALGATTTVRWRQVTDLSSYLDELRKANYLICALEQGGRSRELYATKLHFPLALVVGHEREGVTPETLARCDLIFDLPMRGHSAHSLNVATATGIALYELVRRVWYYDEVSSTPL